jgi:diguanylate cyclase (GGDEF)-like protein/putative nucleotidyltransferase with HDIG domain
MLLGAVLLGWNLDALGTGQFWWLLGLSILGSFSLILKVVGATERSHYNISFLVYAFTLILLGLPAAILVITISHLVEWTWHKYPWYIQLFNLTSYIVVMEAAGLMFGWINPGWSIAGPEGILAVLAAMVLFTFLNHLMIGGILWLARGENFKKSGIFDFFPLLLDFILLSLGAGAALVWGVNPFGIVLILMPLYLIYITLRVPALERKSETDAKTGLFNAKYFSRALESELARANRFNRPMTVIMADLDLLRNINNTYGHLAGDEVLINVAKILRESVREYDVVARFGGEEFSILVPETSPREIFERVELIRKMIEHARFPIPTSATPIQITMSFGIAGREGSNQTPKDLIHHADIALYHAKLTGRNRTSLYSIDQESANDDLAEEQASGNAVPQALSLEERIKLCEFPYQANPLREGHPKGSLPAGEVESLNDDLFGILANAVDLRDPFIKKHSDQVARYAGLVSKKLGLPEKQVELITKGGLIHDVGRLGIPDAILNKRSSLEADEYETIKQHPTMGAELLKNFHALRGMMTIVRHHHERFDGKGYPDGLAGYQIPLEARIVCVADSVEAMASDRPYRRARTLEEIKAELREHSGTQFDPDIARAFIELIETGPEDLLVNSACKWNVGRSEEASAHPLTDVAPYLFEN